MTINVDFGSWLKSIYDVREINGQYVICCPFCQMAGYEPDTKYHLYFSYEGKGICFRCGKAFGSADSFAFTICKERFNTSVYHKSIPIPQKTNMTTPPTEPVLRGSAVYKYLRDREVTEEDICYWNISEVNYSEISSKELTDYFYLTYNTIFFPIYGMDNDLIYFQTRNISEKKYYSAKNWYISKNTVLYNIFNLVKQGIKECMLVEGVFDVITLRRNDINAIALLGSSMSKIQEEMIAHYFDKVTIWLDPDAGTKAEEIKKKLDKWGKEVDILVRDKEPDDYFRRAQ